MKELDDMPESVHLLMQQAVRDNVFPGAVLMASKEGRVLFREAYGLANLYTRQKTALNTVFDLASLTKPLATTLAVLMLNQENRLEVDQELGDLLPEWKDTPKARVRIRHLLNHTSGLPAYQPYFNALRQIPFADRQRALRKCLNQERLVSGIGEAIRYSDIGFMVLEWVVERISGVRLDRYVHTNILEPLNIPDLFFVDLEQPVPDRRFAATEACPWRRILLNGMVHDDNAYITGGIAGHAGLFGTAVAVHRLLMELTGVYHGMDSPVFSGAAVRQFLTPPENGGRALGFDVPSPEHSSSGDLFGKGSTIGHLGFTGTSFWLDLQRQLIVILLTNRVHPSRNNEQIKNFRPRLHNAVLRSM